MQHTKLVGSLIVAATGCTALAGIAAAQAAPQAASDDVPKVVAHSSAISSSGASLTFTLSNGETAEISLVAGEARIQGSVLGTPGSQVVGQYEPGGDLEAAWQRLVSRAGRLDPAEMLTAVQHFAVDGLTGTAAETIARIVAPFSDLEAAPIGEPVAPAAPLPPSAVLTPALDSAVAIDLSALERLEALKGLEALEALEGLESLDIEGIRQSIREQVDAAREAARSAARYQAVNPPSPSVIGKIGSDLVGLFATFVALCSVGFGLVFFAPRQLEVVADTVRQSFWRSFLAGLFAQPLIIPVLGLLLLGLALTIVGILLLPFAIIGFAAATTLAVLGGYLAVARSVGEMYLRKKMSQGHAVGGWLSYRYIVYGLAALSAIWLPAVLLGWIPFAGQIAGVSAVLLTWMLATAGFGATILSRAGIRATFTRRLDQALSDEYLYHTPQATPVVRSRQRIPRSRQ